MNTTQWSDPQVVTALSIGIAAFLISLTSIYFTWRQSQTIDRNTSWEIYRDCILCHIEHALRDFEEVAQVHRILATLTKEGLDEHMKKISPALTKLAAAGAFVDRYEETIEKDWERVIERQMERLFALVGRLNSAEILFEDLKKSLREISDQIIVDCHDRKTRQRAAMQKPKRSFL